MTPLLAQAEPGGWMPPQASTISAEVDWVFSFIFWIALFFFALIVFLMLLFIVKYRRRKGHEKAPGEVHSNLGVEIVWSAIPLIVVISIFWVGFKTFMNMITVPDTAYEINVIGQRWTWLFEYKGGWVDDELHVPLRKPVLLIMRSEDVIHSFFIPAFRVKMDVVPGRYSKLWFNATRAGVYAVRCAEFCGTGHSEMISKVIVHEPGGYEKWLRDASNILSPLLRVSDFTDAGQLARSLAKASTPAHTFFQKGLSDATRALLAAWSGAGAVSDELREALVGDLNELLKGESVHTPERFTGITLSEETSALLAKKPEGEGLLELNRFLLSEAFPGAVTRGPDLAEAGRWIFEKKGGCTSCHTIDGKANIGPSLLGLVGSVRRLEMGKKVTADENYIRESIMNPSAKVVAGFQDVMPTMKGRLSDREIDALIAFFKTLGE